MSNLSSFLHSVENFFTNAAAKNPALAPAIGSAAASAGQAALAVESALPAVANDVVNYAVGLIPGGTIVAPLADEFLDAIIAGLMAKKSTAAPAAA